MTSFNLNALKALYSKTVALGVRTSTHECGKCSSVHNSYQRAAALGNYISAKQMVCSE